MLFGDAHALMPEDNRNTLDFTASAAGILSGWLHCRSIRPGTGIRSRPSTKA